MRALWEVENDATASDTTPGITLGELREWDEGQREGASDYLGHRSMWNSIVGFHGSATPLVGYEPKAFWEEYIEMRSETTQPQTWRRETAKLKLVIEEAMRRCVSEGDDTGLLQLRSLMTFYPTKIKSAKSTSELRGKIHPPVVVERFLSALPEHWRNQYVFARNTGIRAVELRRMTYDCIKMDSDGNWFALLKEQDTKSKEGRDVPLNGAAMRALRSQRDLHPTNSHIWCDWDGQAIKAATEEAGYDRMIYLRDCRHFFATQATLLSGDPKAVRDILGHKDLKMTERYLHSDAIRRRKVVLSITDEGVNDDIRSSGNETNTQLSLTSNLFKSFDSVLEEES